MEVVADDLRARNAIVIAKSCYYHDVRSVGPGVPLFDDLKSEYQCRYMELADYILAELEDYIG